MRLWLTALLALALLMAGAAPAVAAIPQQENQTRLRVVHASPDAPAVDVRVNDETVLSDVEYQDISDYLQVQPGAVNIQVVPAEGDGEAVISARQNLQPNTDRTLAAVGRLDDIEPLLLTDDNALPQEGQAKVRFVHVSPNAPAVDVAVRDGRVLFEDVPFREAGDYVTVDAGTVSLEVRPAGQDEAVLEVGNVALQNRTVYTIWAMGLLDEDPPLEAVISVDAAPPEAPVTPPAVITPGAAPARPPAGTPGTP